MHEPRPLGNVQFLWEWQDNAGENLNTRLNRWLGDKTLAATPVSGISRYFLEQLFTAHQSATYPMHAYNCSVPCGGKRGAAHPLGSPVFPDQDGTGAFPT